MSEAAKAPEAKPAPGTPEHDAAMVALAESRMGTPAAPVADTPAKPEKPADVPDKFWNAEKGVVDYAAMTKSYTELEKKLGQKAAPAAEPDKGKPAASPEQPKPVSVYAKKALLAEKGVAVEEIEKLAPEALDAKYTELSKPATPAVDPAKAAAEAKGVDFKALGAEYAANDKKLSDKTYADLEAKGYPRDIVDTFIAGQQARAAQYDAGVFALVGGEAEYAKMIEWMGPNVPDAEKILFNKAVESMDPAQAKIAVTAVRAQYLAANGEEPAVRLSGTGIPDAVGGFKSRQEQSAAINDKRYRTDPAYRKGVEQRIAQSQF